MLYFIQTFGCQSNKSDSERIAGDYEARGWKETKSWRQAANIIINTCAVRQRAEDRVVGLLRNITEYFESHHLPKPKIILTGCMTHHGERKLLEMLPAVDEILPIGEVGFNSAAVRKDKKHAWVPISSGCNSFCTYCIVPYSRGREQSRPMEDILAEVEKLVGEGYEEITLLGQNVNSYGLEKVGIGLRKLLMKGETLERTDIPTNQSQYIKPKGIPPFVRLLREVSKFPSVKMIRFLTANPWDFSDELISEIASNPKIDKFVHLPVQSGSNRILELMNRGYTREDYLAVTKKLRDAVPGLELGTDIIVGFPGESDKDFADTVSLASEIDFKVGFVAQYSPRPGTASARLYEDDITPRVKKERWEILDEIINKKNLSVRPKVVK